MDIKEYRIEEVNLDTIKVDGSNPNQMTHQMRKRLESSVEEWGNTQPIVVDKTTMLLADGEHRYNLYKQRGMKKIPAILVDFKSDIHRRAYRQAANKIHGEHNQGMDAKEFELMIESGREDLMKLATGMGIGTAQRGMT